MINSLTRSGIEELQKSANDSITYARAIYLTFLIFIIYSGIISLSLTDIQLLRNDPIPIPLLNDSKIPVSMFFLIAPWIIVILHTDLFLHFYNISQKVVKFNEQCFGMLTSDEKTIRLKFNSFTYLIWLGRGNTDSKYIDSIYGFVTWISVVFLPLLILIVMQTSFLKFQSVGITWTHRAAIVSDILIIIFFWPKIEKRNSYPLLKRKSKPSTFFFLFSKILCMTAIYNSFLVSLVIDEPLELLIDRNLPIGFHVSPASKSVDGEKSVIGFSRSYDAYNLRYILFNEKSLYEGSVSENLKFRIKSSDPRVFGEALTSISGVDLKGRRLRYAQFNASFLPKVDLRFSDITHSSFILSDMKFSRFEFSNVIGVNFKDAKIQGSILSNGLLIGNNFNDAQMESVRIYNGRTFFNSFQGSNLESADVRGSAFLFSIFLGAKSDFMNNSRSHLVKSIIDTNQFDSISRNNNKNIINDTIVIKHPPKKVHKNDEEIQKNHDIILQYFDYNTTLIMSDENNEQTISSVKRCIGSIPDCQPATYSEERGLLLNSVKSLLDNYCDMGNNISDNVSAYMLVRSTAERKLFSLFGYDLYIDFVERAIPDHTQRLIIDWLTINESNKNNLVYNGEAWPGLEEAMLAGKNRIINSSCKDLFSKKNLKLLNSSNEAQYPLE